MDLNIILGAGGYAREVEWMLYGHGEKVNFFIVDDQYEPQNKRTLRMSELFERLHGPGGVKVFAGVGDPATRALMVQKFKDFHFPRCSYLGLIQPNRTSIGSGTLINQGSVLTCDITVGEFTIINLNCTVGHDSVIGNYVTMSPGCNISGNVTIGDFAELGTNVIVLPGVKIGTGAIIGAGSVVTKDVPDNTTSVGIPAKVIKTR